ncbi:DUF262 domain-containing protein [Pseudomonas syringae group genomosp. 3]|uniref:GmrSD restriction endonucleases N-terminal domain-containing protein n=1 Tax=Pseudomonas syringae pv. primulae TaxID=251707 RepID=A0A3M3YHC8_9PSED|nr:DUF262 domain-containing protein [Pseudomonas syringae group genomosp. 3]RMO81195.1 hypothetical protein ALQ36_00134 [Pseudomonas syringae pv. primulae]RMU42002.1 hypothetical protein ALP30_03590 [Pseudomonas syringae pv. primulae]
MVEYRVRSVSLLNLVNDIRAGRLIPDAYFQRNLVWRDVHKREFIKTILLGLPFPQIFISKGKVDVKTMSTVSCIVDGQQRSNAIVSFILEGLDVDGVKYSGLSESQKAEFLKYEVAVIELDLENDDPKVQDIFQRINRTSNSLTSIEKLASAYSTSDYMLVAKFLSDHISLDRNGDDDFREDPNIPEDFFIWANSKKVKSFSRLVNEKGVFNTHEIARKTNLMHVLNIMAAIIGGFSNRNEKAIQHLDDYALKFDERDYIVDSLEAAAELFLKLGFRGKSYWLNKTNFYSLIVAFVLVASEGGILRPIHVKEALESFEKQLPNDYRLAATEAVNSTRARQLRNKYLMGLLLETIH